MALSPNQALGLAPPHGCKSVCMAILQVLTCGRDEETLTAAIADWKGQGLEVDVSLCCSAEACWALLMQPGKHPASGKQGLLQMRLRMMCARSCKQSSEQLLQISCATLCAMLGGMCRV